MPPMLVVGSVAFDTLHLPSGSHQKVLGGSATYASLAGSIFAPAQLVGVVGRDYPDSAVRLLKDHDVDIEGLEHRDGLTFHWEGEYAPDLTSRKSLRTDLNVFAEFHPKIPARFRDTPYVLLGNIGPDLQLEVLEQLRAPKLVVADTMNFWIETRLADLKKLLKRVDVLVINDEEARQLAETYNIALAARELLAMGPRTVVIKRGEHGAMLWQGDTVFWAPAFPLFEVVDPTGAGDTFAGAMLGFIAAQDRVDFETVKRAVVYGSATASHCVQGVGPDRVASVTREQVDARYHEFRRLAEVPQT